MVCFFVFDVSESLESVLDGFQEGFISEKSNRPKIWINKKKDFCFHWFFSGFDLNREEDGEISVMIL